jgi:NAD(P)-dependent dehydrogenase (short-subunit alcohol dehydrogenase family)
LRCVDTAASIDSAIKAGIDRFGKLDAVINNAGYGQYGVFEGVSAEKIQQNFDVNLFGVMNVMRAVIPIFRQQGGGLIINVSSVGGLVGLPGISTYLSTKFALKGFTESVSTNSHRRALL